MVNEVLTAPFILAKNSGGAPEAHGGRAPARAAERFPEREPEDARYPRRDAKNSVIRRAASASPIPP
jgi:hypothetical protein